MYKNTIIRVDTNNLIYIELDTETHEGHGGILDPESGIWYEIDTVVNPTKSTVVRFDDTNVVLVKLDPDTHDSSAIVIDEISGNVYPIGGDTPIEWDLEWIPVEDGAPDADTNGLNFLHSGGGVGSLTADGFLVTNGSSATDSIIRPPVDWNPSSGIVECEFEIKTMPPSGGQGWLMCVVGFHTSLETKDLWANHINATSNGTGHSNCTNIFDDTVAVNTTYVMRFVYSPELIEVYWDGEKVYEFEGTRVNTRNRFMVNLQVKNSAILYKAIRLKSLD